MNDLRPTPTSSHGNKQIFTFRDLETCSHVFLRHDVVKPPLQPAYDGPYKGLRRDHRTFRLLLNESTVVRPPSRQIVSNPHTSPMKTHHNPPSLHQTQQQTQQIPTPNKRDLDATSNALSASATIPLRGG
ncbi:hypothetical protein GEV33_002037 [Tenebrio molitor]|jgi:hypothetical protein|uniref:Uncharacterized protein n=1 Tax=Tenebrio molitor TaxID=7067 RepID=A0A8J6HTX4_TENMO|nr:hypothetical protein GEV33_002037 [Tenebrio molitor]